VTNIIKDIFRSKLTNRRRSPGSF